MNLQGKRTTERKDFLKVGPHHGSHHPPSQNCSSHPVSQQKKPPTYLEETTNQRLNTLYHKFISKHRESRSHIQKEVSVEQHYNSRSEQSQLMSREEENFLNPYQMSIDKDISIDRVRNIWQELVENSLEVYDQATTQYLKFIFDKFSDEIRRLTEAQQRLKRLEQGLAVMGLRKEEAAIMKKLNKELEGRIINLESEISTQKANKDLSGLRHTLEKARENNLVRERNPTPGKDSRFQIQKKLLMKENMELKKEIQHLKNDYESRLLELRKMSTLEAENETSFDEREKEEINREKEQVFREMVTHTETLESQLEMINFQLERKNGLVFELQEKLKEKRHKTGGEDLAFKLKYEAMRVEQEAKVTLWNNKLDSRNKELEEAKSKVTECQQQLQRAKKEMLKMQTENTSNNQEIEELRAELSRLKKETQDSKNKLNSLKTEDEEMDVDCHVLESDNDKLRCQISRLTSLLASKEERLNELDTLTTEASLLRQLLKSEKEKSISRAVVTEAIKRVINIEPPKLKDYPPINALLLELYEEMERSREEILERELEVKELRMHKNRLDHVLHEEDEDANEFETTQIDAHFYRARPTTDAVVKEELKKVAKKLDFELQANIDANQRIKTLGSKIKSLQNNQKRVKNDIKNLVESSLPLPTKQTHLKDLLEWSDLMELYQIYHKKVLQ